jgi:hypothetical protein
MEMIDASGSKTEIGGFKPTIPEGGPSLEEMFDKIKIVGRENEDAKSEKSLENEDDDDDSEFDLNKTFMEDPNKIS